METVMRWSMSLSERPEAHFTILAGPTGMAFLLVWLRLSSNRQLDWYRNSAHQSKDIAHVQKALAQRMTDKVAPWVFMSFSAFLSSPSSKRLEPISWHICACLHGFLFLWRIQCYPQAFISSLPTLSGQGSKHLDLKQHWLGPDLCKVLKGMEAIAKILRIWLSFTRRILTAYKAFALYEGQRGEYALQTRTSQDPLNRYLARLGLAVLPRGGGDGDAIRMGILHIMREHGIREGHRPASIFLLCCEVFIMCRMF